MLTTNSDWSSQLKSWNNCPKLILTKDSSYLSLKEIRDIASVRLMWLLES